MSPAAVVICCRAIESSSPSAPSTRLSARDGPPARARGRRRRGLDGDRPRGPPRPRRPCCCAFWAFPPARRSARQIRRALDADAGQAARLSPGGYTDQPLGGGLRSPEAHVEPMRVVRNVASTATGRSSTTRSSATCSCAPARACRPTRSSRPFCAARRRQGPEVPRARRLPQQHGQAVPRKARARSGLISTSRSSSATGIASRPCSPKATPPIAELAPAADAFDHCCFRWRPLRCSAHARRRAHGGEDAARARLSRGARDPRFRLRARRRPSATRSQAAGQVVERSGKST